MPRIRFTVTAGRNGPAPAVVGPQAGQYGRSPRTAITCPFPLAGMHGRSPMAVLHGKSPVAGRHGR